MNDEQVTKYLQDKKKLLLYQLKLIKAVTPDGFKENIISKNERGAIRYYHRNDEGLTYTTDSALITDVLQKQYNRKVYSLLFRQIKLIDKYLSNPMAEMLDEIFNSFNKNKQKFITPLQLGYNDPKIIDKWKIKEHTTNPFTYGGPEHYSMKGLRVRSKSESLIADGLDDRGVPFQYEVPINANGKLYYPDFRCLNLRTGETAFWEHLGKMGDQSYANEQIIKLRDYREAGLILGRNLIVTMESGECPLNNRDIERVIRDYLL